MPPTSSAAAWPGPSATSATTTLAPSDANRRAVSSPMPLAAPVMTATRPSNLPVTQTSVAMKTFLTSVNESRASGPSSRPSPDCLNPPNGVAYRTEAFELTDRLPACTPLDTRSARPRSRVQIDPDSPYAVSLAIATACASSSNGSTATTGPKTSSRHTRSRTDVGRTTVGGYQKPGPSGAEPRNSTSTCSPASSM